MKQTIPTSEIIDDLLAENWQLRWQVIEIFDQVRLKYQNHAHISKEQKEVLQLGKKLCNCLNGPNDHNLHLILTAAYFLGGNHFLFLIFKHLGIDDSDDFYPTLAKLKKSLTSEPSNVTFFDYFHSLLSSSKAVERTTAIAAAITIRLFSPAKSFLLLTTIPHAEPRLAAFELFQEAYPVHFFNDYLLAPPQELLFEQPELLRFIGPPLTAAQSTKCATLINSLLTDAIDYNSTAISAIGRLKLNQCRALIPKLKEDNPEIDTVLAQLGEESGCRKLLAAGESWRRRKRVAALPGLGFCNSFAALEILKKRYLKGDRNERNLALIALGRNLHPNALPFLISTLKLEAQLPERRLVLKILAQHPNAAPNPDTANQLARWHDDKDLYPELLEALETFGYGDEWGKIVTALWPPLRLPHQQKIALSMTRFANYPEVRKNLIALLTTIDWPFSFRLLTLLQPFMNGKDLGTLLKLLQECEEARELTIQELLTQGDGISNFNDALCEHLNLNPMQTNEALSRFIADLVDGKLPTKSALTTRFQKQPLDLKKLILGATELSSTLPEPSLPLLHFLQLLSEIDLNGSNGLVAVINRTRKYPGFFRQLISFTISTIIEDDPELQKTQALSDLQAIIDFMRQRPYYDQLRQKILLHISQITRNAKDLRVYIDAALDRDLRVISIKKTSPNK